MLCDGGALSVVFEVVISTEPLVTVVIPTRNRLALLQRAIDSIDAQDYDAVEVVVVDNQSDRPLGKAELRTRFDLRIFRNERMLPLPTNRNLGADLAQAEFLCFLDDDDSYLPMKLRQAVTVLVDDPILDFVYGDTRHVAADRVIRAGGPPDLTDFLRWRYIHMNSIMIRKAAFSRSKFDEKMTTYEDVEFMSRLMRGGFKGRHIPEVHAIWNRDNRPDQMTRKNWKRAYQNWKRLCEYNDAPIRADAGLRRFYHRKMLALSIMQGDVAQSLRSVWLAR